MDSRGSMAIELGIVLVLILLISGAILISVENTTDKILNAEEKENMEALASEAVDNLINNPGVPDNWHEIKKGTPGLAVVSEDGEIIPNSVSYQKFMALADNYKKLIYENLFNSKIKTSMEMIPQKSSISSVKIGSNDESGNVFSVNRLVKCDFYRKYVMNDFQNPGKCNHNHDQDSHSCSYFKIFKGNLKNSNYYLLIDDSETDDLKYMVDTTRVVKGRYFESCISDCIYLNDKISFYDDDSAVVFIHFDKPKAKAVLVSVPKDFDREKMEYDYFKINECEFVLKGWY
ncbi:MAG: hypothetical protein Q4Q14_06790 [Methanobrevibacter sp.]|nr:hypothetical protein [Methanobrevibacter sp.]